MSSKGTRRIRHRRVADKDRKRVALARRSAELSPANEMADAIAFSRAQSPPLQGDIRPPTLCTNKDQEPSVLSQRVLYLEKIVQHKLGPMNLDLNTLQSLSEQVDKQNESISPARNATPDQQIVAVDEKCCAQSVENTVARETFRTTLASPCMIGKLISDVDFSGEFSHWNFSMHIKKWIEQNISQDVRPKSVPPA
ncbi:uncharacterized protein N7487_003829 [Penicillium crustosum]|uniref:uncharacterized protein n=1 Tax=Penicillium crustosum TaxID=36656 RepID=UPI0023A1BA65|nr:uncharacterized protein N7487_003829 [Penicillium crustosum]KAJ5409470.1 hypothetical protein N7487_003829 [Penicillium crustosum]